MKFVAILSLAILAAADTNGCFTYVCDPSGVTWGENVCSQPSTTNTTVYDVKTGECSSDQPCTFNGATATCQAPTPPVAAASSFPGEKCDGLRLCIQGNCGTDGICPPITPCVYPQDCGLGKYCNAGTCTPQVALKGACVLDTDCVNNAGCDIAPQAATGTCVQYSTVPTAGSVQQCAVTPGQDLANHALCSSGYCYETAGKFVCSGAFSNSATLPNRCPLSTSMCTSTKDTANSGFTLEQDCECGYDGFPYCPQFPGDPDFMTFASDIQTFLGSSNLANCNTGRHGAQGSAFYVDSYFWCAQNLTDTETYHYLRAIEYAVVVMAPSCVLKVLDPEYYQTEAAQSLFIGGLLLALLQ